MPFARKHNIWNVANRKCMPLCRDLRGNAFECDCRAKWLMTWLKNTNATVSDVICAGPEDMKDKRLNDMASLQNECISTGETPEPVGIVTSLTCISIRQCSSELWHTVSDVIKRHDDVDLVWIKSVLSFPSSHLFIRRFYPPSVCGVWISVCWHFHL